MPAPSYSADERLLPWEQVRTKVNRWVGLLLGNGASRAVWDRFHYGSLYDTARASGIAHPLRAEDEQIFSFMGTFNFERVLSALSIAEFVNNQFAFSVPQIRERYASIQRALAEAVRAVHLPWSSVTQDLRRHIRSELLTYKFVYTTNYDLINYWSIMLEDFGQGFKDYFWSDQFDFGNIVIWDDPTRVLYLHGGLHLCRLPTGGTIKLRSDENGDLLAQFGKQRPDGAVPLFITEGKSKDKLISIYRSDYLAFAYGQFSMHKGPMAVFGHALSNEYDGHLIAAMKTWDPQYPIAISMLPAASPEDAVVIVSEKARLSQLLPDKRLIFYDATTHPLGNSTLRLA